MAARNIRSAPAVTPCPAELPADLRERVRELAAAWAGHPTRPTPTPEVAAAWDMMIHAWARATDLPLFVRKHRDDRGQVLAHASSRALVPVDNSPAQWAYALACRGVTCTLDDVRALLAADEVPVAMIFKGAERAGARYRRTLGAGGTADAGWKLGHIEPVGMRTAAPVTALPIATLEAHHRLLLSPSNLFVVPLAWAGLAELPEVTAAMRDAARLNDVPAKPPHSGHPMTFAAEGAPDRAHDDGPADTPSLIDAFPGRDAVGRVYALYDHDRRGEVLGTVVACWPDCGPTWAVRLHDLGPDRRPVVVYLYERPASKLGRWVVTREVPAPKPARYAALVAARKAYDSEGVLGLANPSRAAGGRYDADEVGSWTRWAGDLEADLMVVGQDWGDVAYFERNRGLDAPGNPTSHALAELLAGVGRPLPPSPTAVAPLPPGGNRGAGVFLTNALLWLKTGGMQALVPEAWFGGDSATFLLEQVALVQPRVVVALGRRAHDALLRAYDLPASAGPFRRAVEAREGTQLPGVPGGTALFAAYHCGARVRNTHRGLDDQRRDWARVARALRTR